MDSLACGYLCEWVLISMVVVSVFAGIAILLRLYITKRTNKSLIKRMFGGEYREDPAQFKEALKTLHSEVQAVRLHFRKIKYHF